jgi:hypothetical protein
MGGEYMNGVLEFGAIPSYAALTGTMTGSDSFLNRINADLDRTNFFGSVRDSMVQCQKMFVDNWVNPIKNTVMSAMNLIGMVNQEDRFIVIDREELLGGIPICMHDPIMRYEPVRKLFEEGRIFGFGWDYVPEDDIYKRLIDNGDCDDVLAAMDDEGEFELSYEFCSTDPDLSFDELECIRESRDYIDRIINETDLDPTDYPNDRG